MIRAVTLFAVIGLAMAALSLTGCDNGGGSGGGDPTSASYSGYNDDGSRYKLTVKEPGKAAYSPKAGDIFTLVITKSGVSKTISGTVQDFTNNTTFTLDGDGTLTITVSGSGITDISGTFGDFTGPGTVKPGNPPSSGGGSSGNPFVGTWTCVVDGVLTTITVTENTWKMDFLNFPSETVNGTYSYDGNNATTFKSSSGETSNVTVSGNNLIVPSIGKNHIGPYTFTKKTT